MQHVNGLNFYVQDNSCKMQLQIRKAFCFKHRWINSFSSFICQSLSTCYCGSGKQAIHLSVNWFCSWGACFCFYCFNLNLIKFSIQDYLSKTLISLECNLLKVLFYPKTVLKISENPSLTAHKTKPLKNRYLKHEFSSIRIGKTLKKNSSTRMKNNKMLNKINKWKHIK